MDGGFDDAAQAVAGFVEAPVDVGAALAGEFKLIRGGQAADAAADDGDVLHAKYVCEGTDECWRVVQALGPPDFQA